VERERLLCVLAAIPLAALSWMFTPEFFAGITHLRYGNNVNVSGYSVPLRWDDVVTHSETALLISHWPGNFRRDWLGDQDTAMVSYSSLSSRERDFVYARDRARLDQQFLSMGEHFSSKQLLIAGTKYACWEFEPNVHVNIGNKSAWNVDCRPEDDGLRIFFFGSHNLVPSFYDGLSRITRTQG
jgi:hypothetical protein